MNGLQGTGTASGDEPGNSSHAERDALRDGSKQIHHAALALKWLSAAIAVGEDQDLCRAREKLQDWLARNPKEVGPPG